MNVNVEGRGRRDALMRIKGLIELKWDLGKVCVSDCGECLRLNVVSEYGAPRCKQRVRDWRKSGV